jgi:hypothetical protein
MGQGPFQYPTPDGYPDEAAPWLGTLLWRWNFALALASGHVPTVTVSPGELARSIGGSLEQGLTPAKLLPHFIGRAGTEAELKTFNDYVVSQNLSDDRHKAELLGLILASPAFQRC